jgi:hypothetical protein
LPLRVIIDDHCATAEDWAGLTGNSGYDGTCFVRLAPSVPASPASAGGFSPRTWVGFDSSTTYRLADGVLRKRVAADEPALFNASRRPGDELDDAFYATADQMSLAQAEQFARALAMSPAMTSPELSPTRTCKAMPSRNSTTWVRLAVSAWMSNAARQARKA